MNIVLIGMRGSGKSTIGRIVAEKLNKKFVETDRLIEIKEIMTVAQLVKKRGWKYFRSVESKIAKEISTVNNAVIATGGGMVVRPENVAFLKRNGFFILLKANAVTLIQRIGKDPNRPSLTHKKTLRDEMEEVWNLRKRFYIKAADDIIETDDISKEEIANEIISIAKTITL